MRGVHAAVAFLIGVVGSKEDGSVMNGLVASHPKTEGVTDKHLFNAFAICKLCNHLKSIGDGAV